MRHRKWTDDEEINDILNNPTNLTADIAKFDRIMQHRAIEAMNGLHEGLRGVMETIHRAAGLAVQKADDVSNLVGQKVDNLAAKADAFAAKMDDVSNLIGQRVDNFAAKVDDFATEVKNASTVQSAQQGKLVLLTWVIAIATAVYAGLNIVTAFEMSQANAIQRDMVAATNKAADAAIAANLIQRDMVTATNTAAQAAIAANEIQRQALENSKALSKHK